MCGSGTFYLIERHGYELRGPHVAGAGAVIESTVPGNQAGGLLQACIFQGADQIDFLPHSPLYGRGRLDVFDSVSLHPCEGGSVTE